MKILKIAGIILVAIVALFLLAGLFAPKEFAASESIVINAPADVVYKHISHFKSFEKWNPWSKLDPNQVITLEGTDGTVGAKHSWKGNDDVGEGSMTVTKLEPGKGIEYDLHFIKPWEAHNTAYMNMEAAEGGQKVTWGMKGAMPFPMNALGLFMNMGDAIKKDFTEGLTSLKTMCESDQSAGGSAYEVSEIEWAEKNCLAIRQVVKFQDMSAFFGTHYPKMFEAITKGGGKPGVPLGVYYMYDEEKMEADMAAAIPYEGGKVAAKGYSELKLPATKAYSMDYYGDYAKMQAPYATMFEFMKKNFNRENPDMVVEEYISDPMSEPDTTKWHTKIYFFVNQPQ